MNRTTIFLRGWKHFFTIDKEDRSKGNKLPWKVECETNIPSYYLKIEWQFKLTNEYDQEPKYHEKCKSVGKSIINWYETITWKNT